MGSIRDEMEYEEQREYLTKNPRKVDHKQVLIKNLRKLPYLITDLGKTTEGTENKPVPPHYEEQRDRHDAEMRMTPSERELSRKNFDLESQVRYLQNRLNIESKAKHGVDHTADQKAKIEDDFEGFEMLQTGRSPNTLDLPKPAPKYNLNIEELLTGDINRLHYVQRFSTALVIHRENVAEHSYYVMLYAAFIADWIKEHTQIVPQMDNLLMRALFHDLDECRTGDFIRSFKYSSPQLKTLLEEAASKEMSKILNPIISGESDLKSKAHWYWAHSKDDTPEGIIVSFADYLSVVSHLWAEINSANNTIFQHYDSMIEYLDRLEEPRYDIIRPLVREVSHIVRNVLLAKDARKKYTALCSDVDKQY